MAERESTVTPELLARPRFLGAGYGSMLKKDFLRNRSIYLMAVPVVAFFLVFYYIPMFGLVISFKRFTPALGIFGSPWVGFKYFEDFFQSYFAVRIIRNTILLSVLSLIWGFPAPIILALLINEVRSTTFKRSVQSLTYLPHFISLVVVCGLLLEFSQNSGLFNDLRGWFGGEPISFFQDPRYFRSFYIGSDMWQEIGWGSIIYLAALAAIDPQLYEAATIDGAGRFRQLRHITLPSIAPDHCGPADPADGQPHDRGPRENHPAVQLVDLRDRRRDLHVRVPQGTTRLQLELRHRRGAVQLAHQSGAGGNGKLDQPPRQRNESLVGGGWPCTSDPPPARCSTPATPCSWPCCAAPCCIRSTTCSWRR